MKHKKQTPHLLTNVLLVSTVLLVVALLPVPTMAQDFSDFDGGGDLLVTDGDTSGGSSFTDYIVGEFGVVRATNGAINRAATIYNIGVNVPFAFGKFYATYGGVESEISTTQTLRDGVAKSDDLPSERNITTKTSVTELRDAFIQFDIGSYITLSAGRLRNSWGQFELFSPALALQPVNTNSTSLFPNKLDTIQPQDQVKLSIFPTSRIELSLYSMSSFRRDVTAEENARNLISPYNDDYSNKQRITLDFQEPDNPEQSAARLAFYPNWGVMAFTHHKGYNASVPLLRTPVKFNNAINNDDELGDGDVFGYVDKVGYVETVYKDDTESYLYYPEGSLNAFEISVPIGKWTFRYEVAEIESISGLDGSNGYLSVYAYDVLTKASVDEFIAASNAPTRDEQLRGTTLFESTSTTTAAGFQYKGSEWTFDVSVLTIDEPEPLTEDGKRLVAAYEALEEQQARETGGSLGNFPLVNGFRKRGDEGQHTYGFSMAVLESGAGALGIYSYNFTDDLSIGIAGGYVEINSSASNDDVYETTFQGAGIQVSTGWRF